MDNYYEILGVDHAAEADAIKKAVREKRREWRNKSNHPRAETRSTAEAMIEKIAAAEKVLLDTSRRGQYDRELASYRASPQARAEASEGRRDWVDTAKAYLAQGQASQASYAAREATQAQPQNAEAWYVCGVASVALGQDADAEFELSEALGLRPDMHEAHHELGEIYERHEQWDKAIRCYSRASELLPGTPFYQAELGHVLSQKGQHKEALSLLEAVVAEKPDVDLYRLYLADALLGHAQSKMATPGDDTWTITSAAQQNVAEETSARLRSLQVKGKDKGFDQGLDEWERLTERLGKQKWHHSDHILIWIGAIVFLVIVTISLWSANMILTGLLTAALAGGAGYLYYQRHYVTGWQHNRRSLPAYIVRSGLQ